MSDTTGWNERIAALAGPVTLNVAGFDVAVALTPRQLSDVFAPMLAMLQDRAREQRVLAGVCGIPAGGKTTFAAALKHVADYLLGPGVLAVVGMDGWHYPNMLLDVRTTRDAMGRMVPLRERKGGPESFDVEAMIAALTRLKEDSAAVALPVYDRQIHEPRPDGVIIGPETRIVIVEGNYVLGGILDVPAWDRVAALLSPTFFIECDVHVARERMIQRHMRGGMAPEAANTKYQNNDQLNTQMVLQASVRAEYRIFAFLDTQPAVAVWPPLQTGNP